MSTERKELLTGEFSFGPPLQVIGGDTEVDSEDDEYVRVIVKVNNLRLSEEGHSILVNVYYDIYECQPDHTHLRYNEDCRIPIPYDWNKRAIQIVDVSDFNYGRFIGGENHEWNPLTVDGNSCVDSGYFRFDSDDDHDELQAGLTLKFHIPLIVDDLV